MARVKLNPVLDQISGAVGDLVFRRSARGVVIARKPDASTAEPSEAQLAHRARFRRATAYGRSVMDAPEAKAFYDALARARQRPVFSLTVADFFNAPTVDAVDVSAYAGRVGDTITVEATDDVGVIRVEVVLVAGDGSVLETGEAVPDSGRWVYTAQTAVAAGTAVEVRVVATDRPGGVGEGVATVTVPA